MKKISTYISEKLHINNTTKIEYIYHPKDKDELIKAIQDKIKKEGYGTKDNPLNLNDIDTSEINDMSFLFGIYGNDDHLKKLAKKGTFDVSEWNVSNVKDMKGMFRNSSFNGDISDWDVSNVEDMAWMFYFSRFTGKNGDISDWDVSKVKDMSYMFADSSFDGNLSKWNVNNIEDMQFIFADCPLEDNPPKWYKKYKK